MSKPLKAPVSTTHMVARYELKCMCDPLRKHVCYSIMYSIYITIEVHDTTDGRPPVST